MERVEDLIAALKAACEKCENAVRAMDETKAEKPESDEDKAKNATKLDELQKQYDAANAEFEDLSGKVDEAKKRAAEHAARQEAIEDLSKLKSVEDKTVGAGNTEPAKPFDAQARERAHYEAMRAWMLDKEDDLPEEKRDLIQSKTQRFATGTTLVPRNTTDQAARGQYVNECVLPKSIAAMVWGQTFGFQGAAAMPAMEGKVVLSVDNAVTNPSLAHSLVPQEFKPQLLQLPMPPATVLGMVTRLPTNTGELTFPTLTQTDSNEFGTMSWLWIDEAATKPETEPQFGQITIPCYELAGYTELSHKILIRSAIGLEPLLASIFQSGLRHEMERVILNGTGVGQPLGVIPATGVRQVTRNVAGTVSDTDLVNLKHEVRFYHRDGSYWVMADGVEQRLELTYDTLGRPLFRASTASGPYDRLVGYRYYVSDNSPALGVAGDVIFGNFKYYYLVVEEDITIAKSEHYRFRANRLAIKVFVNVGGRPAQPRAFAFLGGAAS